VALECSGKLDEAIAAAGAVPALADKAQARFEACLAATRSISPFDRVRADELWRMSLAAEAARAPESV
jgi:hypothetical protein